MKNIFQHARPGTIIMICMMVFCGFRLFAQDPISLRVGDAAPSIKYAKWIKGSTVDKLNGDNLYVLEFWATWCGPCRAAMPHLTKLQKQYEGQVMIIGVDVWEDKKKGAPHNTYLPAVEKFVKMNDENMGYAVFADNNEQHMGNNWLKAAGQEGIPSTFIVKEGRIIWIGHPMALDTILPKILDGSYDMIAYKKAFEKEVTASRDLVADWTRVTKPIQESIAAAEYKKAWDLLEKAKEIYPDLRFALNRMKFYTLLTKVNQEEAIAFGDLWHMEDKNAAETILNAVAGVNNLSGSTYLWAVAKFENSPSDDSPFTLHTLASAYAKGGDYKNAINTEENAIKGAEATLKKSKTGAMTEEILKSYKQALAQYKNALKFE